MYWRSVSLNDLEWFEKHHHDMQGLENVACDTRKDSLFFVTYPWTAIQQYEWHDISERM